MKHVILKQTIKKLNESWACVINVTSRPLRKISTYHPCSIDFFQNMLYWNQKRILMFPSKSSRVHQCCIDIASISVVNESVDFWACSEIRTFPYYYLFHNQAKKRKNNNVILPKAKQQRSDLFVLQFKQNVICIESTVVEGTQKTSLITSSAFSINLSLGFNLRNVSLRLNVLELQKFELLLFIVTRYRPR